MATVVSSQRWESDLVFAIHEGAGVRLVGRCVDAGMVARLAPTCVVVGAESPLANPAIISEWQSHGILVVGITDPRDPVSERLLACCDLVASRDDPPRRIIAAVVGMTPAAASARHPLITVTGPRGTPGRTETALTLAWALSEGTTLIDMDTDAPSLSFRLGVSPPRTATPTRIGHISLIGLPPGQGPMAPTIRDRLVAIARSRGPVVIDAGPGVHTAAGQVVVVGEATSLGLIRLARFLSEWGGSSPILVVNRATEEDATEIARAVGVTPVARIPWLTPQYQPSPIEGMVERLAPLVERVARAA